MGARGPRSAASLTVVPAVPTPTAERETAPAPEHLTAATRAWWEHVVSEYDLEQHHLRLLQAAAESWDRLQQARAALATHGLTFNDSKGDPKTRPEVAIERDSRIAFARLIRELDLDTEAPAGSGRPPALRSNRR
ncbi:P27 family phage terminase small subunit [Mesorhizobium sp. AaZ16]|uniref:P27 family phage terminase small subunit n=1 Tax=Mesorhizobium sp. AaZ16 TaxID=3402289 RepID=UPI00374F3F9D